ncbi:MAG: RnfABCDGE type electron transport complex subunit G [Romboutsia sp.]
MKNIVRLGMILFIICAISSLALGLTNKITLPIIEKRNIQANNESRQIVLKGAKDFKLLNNFKNDLVEEVYEGSNGSNIVGYTIKTNPKGYGGKMEVIVGISADGKITGVNIGTNSETPGLGSKSSEPEFKNQYNNKLTEKEIVVVKGKSSNDSEIVAISGATISSKAVTSGVNAAMELFNKELANKEGM